MPMTPSGKTWIPDSERPRCVKCNVRFTMFTRQHHCRYCGEVFCHECSGFSSPMPGKTKSVRVCETCFDTLNGDVDVPILTEALQKKERKKNREEFRLKTCTVVRWSHGEKWDVAVPSSGLRVGDELDLGDEVDSSARIELGVALPSGEHTQTNFTLSDTAQESGKVRLSVKESGGDGVEGTIVLDVTSFAMTKPRSTNASPLLRVLLVLPVLLVFALASVDTIAPSLIAYNSTTKTFLHIVALNSPHVGIIDSNLFTVFVYGLLTLIVTMVTSSKASSTLKTKGPVSFKIVAFETVNNEDEEDSSTKESDTAATSPEDQVDTSAMPDYVASAVKTAMRKNLTMSKPRSKEYRWKPYGDASRGIKFFIASSSPTMKGVAIKAVIPFIPVSPSAVLKGLSMPFEDDRAKKLNPDCQSLTVLKRFDRHTVLRHQKQHGLWPTTPREIVNIVHVRRLESGAILSSGRSVNSPDAPPENPTTFVRMTVFAAGWLLEKTKGSDGQLGTKATYVNHFDAMGSLPKWVVKKGTTVNLNQSVRLCKIIEKDIEEFRGTEVMQNETYEVYAPLALTHSSKDDNDEDGDDDDDDDDTKNSTTNSIVDLPAAVASQVENTLKNCMDMATSSRRGQYCKKWLDFGGKDEMKYYISEDYAFKEGIAIKGVIPFLPATPTSVCEVLTLPQDDLRKAFLNPKIESTERVKEYNSHTFLKYQRNVKAWGSTARDMSVLVHIRQLTNGTIATVVSSLKTDLVPKVSSCVRMKVLAAGWILEPVEREDGTKGTRAIYVNHCDVIRGFVPLSFVKKALKDTLGQLDRLRKIVLDDVAKKNGGHVAKKNGGRVAKKNGSSSGDGSSLKTQKLAQLRSIDSKLKSNNSSSEEVGSLPVPRQSVESRQSSSRHHRDSVLGVDDSCCSVFTPSPRKKARQ